MTPGRAPIAAAMLAVLATVGVTQAATANAAYLQTARFSATMSGTESVAWTMNSTNACGSETGSGSQHVHFQQKGRLTLIFARQLGGNRLLMVKVAGTRSSSIPITGTMTRYGVLNFNTLPKCATGKPEGPAVAPPKPDCGPKSFTGTIDANWSPADSYPEIPGEPTPLLPQLWFDEPYSKTTFSVCPFFGPLILFRLAHAGLAEKRVFGPRPRLTAHRTVSKVEQYPETSQGVRSETTVELTLHLTRLTARHGSP